MSIEGEIGDDNYCCVSRQYAPLEFYFSEETEHNLKYYCVDTLQNVGPIDDEKFKVEGTAFNITLNKKWNLISVPFVMLDDSIEEVFKGIEEKIKYVWTYDAETGLWHKYTPDGIDDNPRNAYTYEDADSVVNQPKLAPSVSLGFSYRL